MDLRDGTRVGEKGSIVYWGSAGVAGVWRVS